MSIERSKMLPPDWLLGVRKCKEIRYAFKGTLKEYTNKRPAAMNEESEKDIGWDDYEIPSELPPPKKRIKTNV